LIASNITIYTVRDPPSHCLHQTIPASGVAVPLMSIEIEIEIDSTRLCIGLDLFYQAMHRLVARMSRPNATIR